MMKLRIWSGFAVSGLLLSGCVTVSAEDFKTGDVNCDLVNTSSQAESAVALLIAPTGNYSTYLELLNAGKGTVSNLLKGNTELQTFVATGDTYLAGIAHVDLSQSLNIETVEKPKIQRALKESEISISCLLDKRNLPAELDLIKALKLVSEGLPENGELQQIVVVSNGLQTAGDLPLQSYFASENSEIISNLSNQNALPDLHNIKVTFLGLGQVSGEQPVFSTKSLNKLQELWAGIVEKSGGTATMGAAINLGGGNPDGPHVTAVAPLAMKPMVQSCKTILEDDNLTFYPNTDKFLDPIAAKQTFDALQELFSEQKCTGTLRVTGFTTNFADLSEQKNVALARANAVAKELSNRFPGFALAVEGVGYDGDGEMDPSNRRVEVLISK